MLFKCDLSNNGALCIFNKTYTCASASVSQKKMNPVRIENNIFNSEVSSIWPMIKGIKEDKEDTDEFFRALAVAVYSSYIDGFIEPLFNALTNADQIRQLFNMSVLDFEHRLLFALCEIPFQRYYDQKFMQYILNRFIRGDGRLYLALTTCAAFNGNLVFVQELKKFDKDNVYFDIFKVFNHACKNYQWNVIDYCLVNEHRSELLFLEAIKAKNQWSLIYVFERLKSNLPLDYLQDLVPTILAFDFELEYFEVIFSLFNIQSTRLLFLGLDQMCLLFQYISDKDLGWFLSQIDTKTSINENDLTSRVKDGRTFYFMAFLFTRLELDFNMLKNICDYLYEYLLKQSETIVEEFFASIQNFNKMILCLTTPAFHTWFLYVTCINASPDWFVKFAFRYLKQANLTVKDNIILYECIIRRRYYATKILLRNKKVIQQELQSGLLSPLLVKYGFPVDDILYLFQLYSKPMQERNLPNIISGAIYEHRIDVLDAFGMFKFTPENLSEAAEAYDSQIKASELILKRMLNKFPKDLWYYMCNLESIPKVYSIVSMFKKYLWNKKTYENVLDEDWSIAIAFFLRYFKRHLNPMQIVDGTKQLIDKIDSKSFEFIDVDFSLNDYEIVYYLLDNNDDDQNIQEILEFVLRRLQLSRDKLIDFYNETKRLKKINLSKVVLKFILNKDGGN